MFFRDIYYYVTFMELKIYQQDKLNMNILVNYGVTAASQNHEYFIYIDWRYITAHKSMISRTNIKTQDMNSTRLIQERK